MDRTEEILLSERMLDGTGLVERQERGWGRWGLSMMQILLRNGKMQRYCSDWRNTGWRSSRGDKPALVKGLCLFVEVIIWKIRAWQQSLSGWEWERLPSPLKSKGSHRATIWICSRVCQHLLLFWGPDPIKDIVRHSFAFFLSAWNELHALEGGSKISVLKQETCWMLKTMYSQLRLQKVQRPLLKGFSLNTYTRFHPLVCRCSSCGEGFPREGRAAIPSVRLGRDVQGKK